MQDIVKGLFADAEINKTHKLAAVNSINWARILAQITYYFHAYFSLLRSANFIEGSKLRFVVPTGNLPSANCQKASMLSLEQGTLETSWPDGSQLKWGFQCRNL